MAGNRIQIEDIKRCVGIVVSQLKMKLEASAPAGEKVRVLLVEGKTDELFIKEKTDDSVKCFSMGGVLKARRIFLGDADKTPDNCKEAIMQTVYGLNVLPMLIDVKGAEKWEVHGIVDRDCENFSTYERSKFLYITDTHDLETLLISSDLGIFDRIDGCTIPLSDLRKALFASYQLAISRDALKEVGISVQVLKSGSFDVDFSAFMAGGKVSLDKMIAYVIEKNPRSSSREVMLKTETDKIIRQILKEKKYKRYFTQEGEFKESLDYFDETSIPQFWTIVNGHDILALIRYYNESAACKYYGYSASTLNRDFEVDLIGAYDYERFKQTHLYEDLLRDNVVFG